MKGTRTPRTPITTFRGRWTRDHWATASLIGCVGVLVAAIVPGFSAAPPAAEPEQVTRAIALPLPPRSVLPIEEDPIAEEAPVDTWRTVQIAQGQTLGGVFSDLGLSANTLHRLLQHPGAREALTRVRAGDEFAFDVPEPGELRALRFARGENEHVELVLEDGGIKENVTERELERRTLVASGEITSSLYAAAARAGVSNAIVNTMANVFSYDIDFGQDLREGDHFSVIYEEVWRDGERLRTGDIVAASFTNRGKRYTAVRFERDGKSEYFSADGRPLKKSFMRMPVEFARISSTFGARRHPILGKMRMHNGVDYAAPTGTPIMAAGDGRIAFAGNRGGYGRTVIVDHGNGHTTLYAHMSRLGRYKTGQRVSQGAVIGYVGMSGLATGPHLHYEFRVNGQHRDPTTVTMPPPEPLKGAAMAQFRAVAGPALAQLEMLEGRHLAAREASTSLN
ncbi:peptidoglycan DD-metalloendopeptidase family protein [Coralloluteibacterium thermophilus]|uniref:Peptidoglycan DD-metalloendopeptidase family protein n=1 Tax=Coralloluteibacterium thermophilum TaxID=2707049 RepID=A0ABV9NK77_9GAMM